MTGDSCRGPRAFEARYAAATDPWNFASSPYEGRRFDTLLEALSRRRYGSIYEPGCSIGVLTARLAPLTGRLIAVDVAPSAVRRAQARCRALPQVQIRCGNVATFQPPGTCDLIVFSEIGYYFEARDLERIAAKLVDALAIGGEFVAAHWLGTSADHILHGDTVHEILHRCLLLTRITSERHAGFRLDGWMRR